MCCCNCTIVVVFNITTCAIVGVVDVDTHCVVVFYVDVDGITVRTVIAVVILRHALC